MYLTVYTMDRDVLLDSCDPFSYFCSTSDLPKERMRSDEEIQTSALTSSPSRRTYSGTTLAYAKNASASGSATFAHPSAASASGVCIAATGVRGVIPDPPPPPPSTRHPFALTNKSRSSSRNQVPTLSRTSTCQSRVPTLSRTSTSQKVPTVSRISTTTAPDSISPMLGLRVLVVEVSVFSGSDLGLTCFVHQG